MTRENWGSLVAVLLFGVMVQLVLAAGGMRQTPYRTAKAFTKAYFQLDPTAMADQLCDHGIVQTDEADVNIVKAYLNRVYDEAHNRGYAMERMRRSFYDAHTETTYSGADAATVHISGLVRTEINPVYGWIGRTFFLTTPRPVSATLQLVKKNGRWKVCGEPFGMKAPAA
jgi:hypothetical protein